MPCPWLTWIGISIRATSWEMIGCSFLSSKLISESTWQFGVLAWNGFMKKSTPSLKAAISWPDAVLVPETSVRWKSSTLQSLSTDFWIISSELVYQLHFCSDTKILLNHQRTANGFVQWLSSILGQAVGGGSRICVFDKHEDNMRFQGASGCIDRSVCRQPWNIDLN